MNKKTLREALSKLVSSKKLKVKLQNGKNSYYIENDSFHEDKNKYQEIEDVKELLISDRETALPQDDIETPKRRTLVKNEIGNNDEIYDFHNYVQNNFVYLKSQSRKLTVILTQLTIALLKPQICSVSILNFYCKKTRLKTLS